MSGYAEKASDLLDENPHTLGPGSSADRALVYAILDLAEAIRGRDEEDTPTQ